MNTWHRALTFASAVLSLVLHVWRAVRGLAPHFRTVLASLA